MDPEAWLSAGSRRPWDGLVAARRCERGREGKKEKGQVSTTSNVLVRVRLDSPLSPWSVVRSRPVSFIATRYLARSVCTFTYGAGTPRIRSTRPHTDAPCPRECNAPTRLLGRGSSRSAAEPHTVSSIIHAPLLLLGSSVLHCYPPSHPSVAGAAPAQAHTPASPVTVVQEPVYHLIDLCEVGYRLPYRLLVKQVSHHRHGRWKHAAIFS